MLVDAKLSGFDQLQKQLRALGQANGAKAMRSAAGFAMTPVVKQARANAPRGKEGHRIYTGDLVAPGFLSRNIKKKTFKSKSGRYASATVGMSAGAFYGEFFERGTKYINKSPWLEPAFESKRREVLKRFSTKLAKNIEKARRKK